MGAVQERFDALTQRAPLAVEEASLADYKLTYQQTIDGEVVTGSIHASPQARLCELHLPEGTQKTLFRSDVATMWLIDDQGGYVGGHCAVLTPNAAAQQKYRQATETLLNEPVTKYYYKQKQADGAMVENTAWVTKEGITLKARTVVTDSRFEAPIVVEMTATEFARGRQPDHLFQLPTDAYAADAEKPKKIDTQQLLANMMIKSGHIGA